MVTPYKELDSIGRKARDAEKRLSCGNCPGTERTTFCSELQREICDYVFLAGFRSGYRKRVTEDNKKRVNNK